MQAMTLTPPGSVSLIQRLVPLMDPLFGFAFSRCHNRETALDATQESLRAALEAPGEWQDEEALWAWLVAVVRNKVANEFRKQRRQPLTLGTLGHTGEQAAQALVQGRDLPVEIAQRAEARQLCRAALSELPPRQREVLEAFYGGQSQAEISQRLEISTKAVESLLARARTAMQAMMQRMVARPEELL